MVLLRATAVLLLLMVNIGSVNAAEEMKWYDAGSFTIEGLGWAETSDTFTRLPVKFHSKLSDTVWNMSRDNSGVSLRFATDADKIRVRWSLVRPEIAMPHMPATGVSGLDLYAKSPKEKTWTFIGNGRPHKSDDNEALFVFQDNMKGIHECILYLPLYNGIKSISIGLPSGSKLMKYAPIKKQKPIVFYGTSITQGGCASRPGMVYSSILGRMLNRPTINLGFSASGNMFPPIGNVLAELNPEVYVIDCLWNIGNSSQDTYDRLVGELVKAIREPHPDVPIVFVGQSLIYYDQHPTGMTLSQEASVKKLRDKGDKNLFVIPGSELIGTDGEATVDGAHLSDLGMQRQAECMYPVLKKLIQSSW